MKTDMERVSHQRGTLKYHIVFALKYRRNVFVGSKRLERVKKLKELCKWNGIEI